jgi:hypothetical protein
MERRSLPRFCWPEYLNPAPWPGLVVGNVRLEPTARPAGARHKADQRPHGEVMKKLSKAILARDAKRDIGAEVLEAIREIKAGGGRKFTAQVSQATEARIKLGQSQADFAAGIRDGGG